MKRMTFSLALALALAPFNIAQAGGHEMAEHAHHDAEALVAAGQQWKALYEAGDWAALRALYNDDAVLMTAGQPKIEGADNIVTFLQRLGNMGADVTFDFAPEEAVAKGNLGFVTAKYQMIIAFPGQDPVNVVGRSFLVYKRSDDGWLLWRDMDNLAPDATAADFAE